MKTRCGRDLPADKVPLHQARCSACGGTPPRPPGSRTPLDYFTDNEALDIIVNAPFRHWKLLLWLLWETGIRIGEALNIKKSDLLAEEREVLITREKKRKPIKDSVPISDDLLTALLDYIPSVKGQYLFPYTNQGAAKALGQAAVAAGIDRPVHPHMFRHALGVKIMRNQGRKGALESVKTLHLVSC